MNNNQSILKAQSPAALAEEYIVKSIWNNHFPPGSDLPAERDLADKIGVTRTTLREVLQRLARDGWLSIQHGKPTRVNNVWETAGPNIISTIIKLDRSYASVLVANVVSLRTRLAEYFIPEAIKLNPDASLALFDDLEQLQDSAQEFAEFDYRLLHRFTLVANKPVYGLILNSFRDLYYQIARMFFSKESSRQLTLQLYQELRNACVAKDHQQAFNYMVKLREATTEMWYEMLKSLPENFGE